MTCIAPESLLTSSAARERTATRPGRSVVPHQLRIPPLRRAPARRARAQRLCQAQRSAGRTVAHHAREFPKALCRPGLCRTVRGAGGDRDKLLRQGAADSRQVLNPWCREVEPGRVAVDLQLRIDQVEVFTGDMDAAGRSPVRERRAQQRTSELAAIADALPGPAAPGHPRRRETRRQNVETVVPRLAQGGAEHPSRSPARVERDDPTAPRQRERFVAGADDDVDACRRPALEDRAQTRSPSSGPPASWGPGRRFAAGDPSVAA